MMLILGRKLGMTQLFQEDGTAVPVTVIQAGPCVVMGKHLAAQNGGHDAIQLGFEPVTDARAAKPQRGAATKAGLAHAFRFVREMHVDSTDEYQVGQELTVERFSVGQIVDVIGVSKGKGFQGVIKRHRHHGGAATHGSMFHRAPGGIGASSFPSRTLKMRGMPGHMGDVRVTAQHLKVAAIFPQDHLIAVRGAVPGAQHALVIVRPSVKVKNKKATA
ncbi:MAG: 50S ribosomal protein L3 [bacterium]|nr:50S ribosomal protein L3 [bacterium]